MNTLVFLVRTPLAKALGWTLVHSLWEGALIALAVGAGLLLCRPASARTRYALACGGMLAMLVAFTATLITLWPAPVAPMAPPPVGAFRFAPSAAIDFPAPPVAPPDRLPWIVPFWMAGVLIFYLRTAGGWLAAQRLRGRGVIAAPEEWQQRLRALAARLRVTRPVVLLESCLAETPVLVGFLRPAILVPAGLLAGIAPDQLEAILLHELAHIRRHDYAVNVMQSLVEGLLFYHPAAWWLSRTVRAEREHCCDDAVVALRGDAAGYAAALAALEWRRAAVKPALAASGGNLTKRIRRLLEPQKPRSGAGPVFAALLLLTPVAVGLLSAWPAKPQAAQGAPAAARGAAPASLPAQVRTPQDPAQPSGLAPEGRQSNDENLKRDLESPYKKWLNQDVASIIYKEWLSEDVANIIAQEQRDALQVAQAQQPQSGTVARPLDEREKQRNEEKLRKELESPYKKWLIEDVAYIITDEERAAFEKLQTDDEREHFIEQFWLRRDPTPGTVENEFKEEHYRRIAYANEHFAAKVPGWKTDRGRIYIMYGPPDEINDYKQGGAAHPFPYQEWRYRLIPGVGTNVVVEFDDADGTGEYHMTMDPTRKATPNPQPDAGPGRADVAPQPAPPGSDLGVAYLAKQLSAEEANLAELRRRYVDSFPAVREATARVANLRAGLAAAEYRTIVDSAGHQQGTAPTGSPIYALLPSAPGTTVEAMAFPPGLAFHVAVGTTNAPGSDAKMVTISIPIAPTDHDIDIYGRITTVSRRRVSVWEDTAKGPNQTTPEPAAWMYTKSIPLPPGEYRLNVIVKDVQSGLQKNADEGVTVQ
jgi:GWxTD domain-containing protein